MNVDTKTASELRRGRGGRNWRSGTGADLYVVCLAVSSSGCGGVRASSGGRLRSNRKVMPSTCAFFPNLIALQS